MKNTSIMTTFVVLGCFGLATTVYASEIEDFTAGNGVGIAYKENGVNVVDGAKTYYKTTTDSFHFTQKLNPVAVYVEDQEKVTFIAPKMTVDGKIYNDGSLTFQGDTIVNGNIENGDGGLFPTATITFQDGNTTLNGAIDNDGVISFQNGIENFDNADWSASAGTGTVNFLDTAGETKTGIAITSNTSTTSPIIQAKEINGNVYFVVENGLVDDNGLGVSIAATTNTLNVKDNALYNVVGTGSYAITPKTEAEIVAGGTYTDEQAALLKSMMGTTGNALFDSITTLVQMGKSADVQGALDKMRPATAAAQFAAFDTTITTMRAIFNHLTPANDAGILAGMKERNHLTFWGEGLYNHTRNDMKKQGFDMHQGGFAVGMDATFIESKTLLGVGYSQTKGRFDSKTDAKTDLDGYTGFLYGAWKPCQFFISAMASYTRMNYEHNKIKWNANVYGGHGTIGYEWGWIAAGIGARYIRVNTDAYTNSYGTKVKTDDADLVTGVVGIHIQKAFKDEKSDWRLVPSARLAGTYDIKQADDKTAVSYNGTHLYTFDGEKQKRFGVETSAGLKLTNGPAELSVNYEGAFREKQFSNGAYATLKYHF